VSLDPVELICTCGSGGHPRYCNKHPLAMRIHIAEWQNEIYEDTIKELEQSLEAAHTRSNTRLRDFVGLILHGDETHRQWLLEAVENFIAGRPVLLEDKFKREDN